MSDKTFFVQPESSNSGGSKFDIMALLPGLMGGGSNRMDPNLIAALMNGRNNQDAWGGGGCWWIWIIVLFFLWGGWGGNGFGANGRNQNGLPSELNNDAGRELLMNAIQGNGTAISQLSSSLGCSTQQLQSAICGIQGQIQQVGNQVGMSSQQIINAVQNQSCEIGRQIADCCCQTNNNITRMGYENQLANCNQTNTLVNTMNGNAQNLRDATLAQTQAILAKLDAAETRVMQDKINNLTAERTALLGQISQEHQNAYFAQVSAQTIAPVNAALGDLSARLAKIECKQPETVTIPYVPAMGSFIPVNYGVNVNPYASTLNGCGC